MKKKFIRWMEDNRGLILTVFGLPLSFIFDLVMQVYKMAIAKKLGSSKYAGSNLTSTSNPFLRAADFSKETQAVSKQLITS